MPVTPASLLAQVADFGVGSMAIGRFGAPRGALPFSAFQISLPLAGDLRKSGSLYFVNEARPKGSGGNPEEAPCGRDAGHRSEAEEIP
jgi:hypothetical protein